MQRPATPLLHSQCSGNVLFVILIAVALFAALSYAVTHSSSGSGRNVENEKALLSSSVLTEYPAAVRIATMRMILGGVDITELEFNPPEDLGDCTSPERCVFHPEGGGVNYAAVPSEILVPEVLTNRWGYYPTMEIKDLGLSVDSDFAGNDILMIVFGVKQEICEKLHERLGLVPPPLFPGSLDEFPTEGLGDLMNTGWTPAAEEAVLGDAIVMPELRGLRAACFHYTNDIYAFYSVIIEQ